MSGDKAYTQVEAFGETVSVNGFHIVDDPKASPHQGNAMRFSEFMDWFNSTDTALGGRPPDLKLWWELKARLDAVASGDVASSPDVATARPAVPAPPPPSSAAVPECFSQHHKYVGKCPYCHTKLPGLDDEALDIQPNPGPVDPEPSDFRQRSRDKDGGLSAEVVDALREQQADLRPTPGVRTPRT